MMKYILGGVAFVFVLGGVWTIIGKGGSSAEKDAGAATVQVGAQNAAGLLASSTAPTSVQGTGQLFAQSSDAPYAHELYPTVATDAAASLGAFSYHVTDLGNGTHAVTIDNNTEGYTPQSVTVTTGQSVYFIERSPRDDTNQEDSGTRDDYLVAVDANGYVLQSR